MKEKKEQLIFRNEWKHSMTQRDYITIRSRLAEIAESSMYAGLGGMYRVRSLAFVEPEEEKKMDLLLPLGRKDVYKRQVPFYGSYKISDLMAGKAAFRHG